MRKSNYNKEMLLGKVQAVMGRNEFLPRYHVFSPFGTYRVSNTWSFSVIRNWLVYWPSLSFQDWFYACVNKGL